MFDFDFRPLSAPLSTLSTNITTFISSHCTVYSRRSFPTPDSSCLLSICDWPILGGPRRGVCLNFKLSEPAHNRRGVATLKLTQGEHRVYAATQLTLSAAFSNTFHTFGFRCIQLVYSFFLSFPSLSFALPQSISIWRQLSRWAQQVLGRREGEGTGETHYAVTLIIISAFRVTFNYAKYFLCSFKRAQLFVERKQMY